MATPLLITVFLLYIAMIGHNLLMSPHWVTVASQSVQGSPKGKFIVGQNPWITTSNEVLDPVTPNPLPLEGHSADAEWSGADLPQRGIPVPDHTDRLGRVAAPALGVLSVVGVHGGSGESTLARWLVGRATNHCWPVRDGAAPDVLLCARTNASGMAAARMAAREWASSEVAVTLIGLVLIEDMPGRLPKQLRQQARHVAGGVPYTWLMPYSQTLRFEDTLAAEPPVEVRPILNAIANHLTRK